MTEPELVEAATNFNGLVLGWLSAYFAAFTAYIVSAYLVGSKLTRSQVVFISAGYLIYSLICVLSVYGAGLRFVDFTFAAEDLNPERIYFATHMHVYIGAALLLLGILGSLKFMWDIRHPRSELPSR